MLALDDLLDMVGHSLAALEQPRQRFRSRGERRSMRFEQVEEIALPREQALEPGKHAIDPCLFRNIEHDPGSLRRDAKAAVAERPDKGLKIGFVDRPRGLVESEPAPLALVHFLPFGKLARHGERKHLDIVHDRGAVRAALAIFIAADRGRADRADHPRLFLGLDRRRSVAVHPGQRIALRDHPAARAARGDEHDFGRAILAHTRESIRKHRNLTHKPAEILNYRRSRGVSLPFGDAPMTIL